MPVTISGTIPKLDDCDGHRAAELSCQPGAACAKDAERWH